MRKQVSILAACAYGMLTKMGTGHVPINVMVGRSFDYPFLTSSRVSTWRSERVSTELGDCSRKTFFEILVYC